MNGSTTRSRKKSKDTLKQMNLRTEQSKIWWDTRKATLKGKFNNRPISKTRKSSKPNITSLLQELEKQIQKQVEERK